MTESIEPSEVISKKASVICAVDHEDSIKREDTMTCHQYYDSLAVAGPVVAARKADLTAPTLSPQTQPTPNCSSANTLKGDGVLVGDSTDRKVAMQ